MNDSVTNHVDTNATWKNVEIAQWTRDGISNYSQHFPAQKADVLSVVAGTQSYSLPSDIIQPPEAAIVKLAWERVGRERDHLSMVNMPPGATERISLTGTGKGYTIWANTVYLEDEPSSRDANYDIVIWYLGLHDQPIAVVNDDLWAFVFSVPDPDQELLYWYVTSCMMGKLESDDSYLRQYADRNDLGIYRDDNPARKSASWRMEQYQSGVGLRLARKAAPRLKRAIR